MAESGLSFHIRDRDCDPYGHLNGANYLRFIEEWNAHAASQGFLLPSWMSATLPCWRPSKTYLEFLRPVRYGDILELQSGVSKIIGSNMLRVYEFRTAGSDQLSAVGSIHWTCLDPDTNLPPDLLREETAVPRDQDRADHDLWIRPPSLPPRPPGAYACEKELEWRDVDQQYILRTSAYLDYCIDHGLAASRRRGWSVFETQRAGLGFFIRKLWIEQFQPVRLGQTVWIDTWLSNLKKITLTRHFTISSASRRQPLGQVHTSWVCVDPATGRLARYPDTWLHDFADQVSQED